MESKVFTVWKEALARTLQLPMDLSSGEAILTLVGEQELLLENYRGIIAYESSRLVIRNRTNRIRIEGEELKICYYTETDMKVTGKILEICYES